MTLRIRPLTMSVVAAMAFLTSRVIAAPLAIVGLEDRAAPVIFAADEIEQTLRTRKYRVERTEEWRVDEAKNADLVVRFARVDRSDDPQFEKLAPEGFLLRNVALENHRELVVLSMDSAGAMYGGLELNEQIRVNGVEGVKDTDRNPYMPLRGTKFNIPLDLRTPSYTDMGDSAQANIGTVWDFEFWRQYLDQLARDRYNMVSLWNLHPFPSMVQVPEYPDIALNDVWRSKAKFAEDYSTRTTDIVTPAMLANKEVVRKLGIEQKIEFWRRVMQYAHDRNIAFYVVTWNVYTYGTDGKYGITDALDNPKTVDYFRASVREMFRTYPLLAGIGLTAGENMGDASAYYKGGTDSFDAKENWLLATYGQGVLDAARAEPQRQFRLIHRQHESRAQDIASTFEPVIAQPNVDFLFSFKYAQAHALSSTTQTFHRGYLESLGNLRTLWTIRNDDALMLRWAAPDFVRDFVKNIPYEKSQGYYVGSDMWVWGREYLSQQPRNPRQLEIDKHWLHVLLWGRLGYDPTLDDTRIAALVGQRFPGVNGETLLAAWQHASMIYPLVTGFHWANFDFQWYIEACRSRPEPAKTASGFHSVETFINQPVHPGTDNLSIPQYVAGVTSGSMPAGTTPVQVAERIDAHVDAVLAPNALAAPRAGQREYAETARDITLMANLGRYYAAKIRGATELALFRATRDAQHQQLAVKHLEAAAKAWGTYVEGVRKAYGASFWTNRVGLVDWQELTAEIRHDVEIAQAPLR
ncbi:MAG TPA: alpha-glucuronidase family glycosyl hydrolase [Steroidobacteraceae bacterium]|nr:alpha-glucuronidase family glycosyl hydrolase [Steroidobacteraceae bacterium]